MASFIKKIMVLAGKKLDLQQKLIQACKKQDRRAQIEVYKLYSAAMYNTALRIVNNPTDAEDVMQEAFIKAFASLAQLASNVTFGSWLKRIVINKSIDFMKQKKADFDEWSNVEEMPIATSSDLEMNTHAKAETIKHCIQELPDGYRTILSLYLLEGYDHEEIAQILNISASTSRSQYTRAKTKLIKLINSVTHG